MMNPYHAKPDTAFWRRAVAGKPASEVDPVITVPFGIGPGDSVATAGSCFAQYISKTLTESGLGYLITEPAPASVGAVDENYGVFPARFGNIYTGRQLLQLLWRAYGLFEPIDSEWLSIDGGYIDPFRPRIQRSGFETVSALRADRDVHLQAVRRMFEQCDVFIFTLGLTEGWEAVADGAVFPLAPGVVARNCDERQYRFHNFTVSEMEADLLSFIDLLNAINGKAKIILTVSPVPLIATYEDRHVLVATTYSKAALRVVADMVTTRRSHVAYFPAYEIITGPQARGQFFEEDLREVKPAGVDCVMSVFKRHYFQTDGSVEARTVVDDNGGTRPHFDEAAYMRQVQEVICDEVAIDAGNA